MAIKRFSPFEQLMRMDDDIKRLGRGSVLSDLWSLDSAESWALPLDVKETDECLIVEASISGAVPEEVEVEIEEDVLTIKGSRKTATEEEKEGYILKERSEGSFYRSIRMPSAVDANKATSTYENGILTITLPKQTETKSKKVKVDISA